MGIARWHKRHSFMYVVFYSIYLLWLNTLKRTLMLWVILTDYFTQEATRLLRVLSSMQHVAEDLMTALSSNTYSIQYPWHVLVTLVKYWSGALSM